MTEVVKARLMAGATFTTETRMHANLHESSLKHVDGDLLSIPSNKELSVGMPGGSLTPAGIFGKHLKRLESDRHEASFKKLRIPDGKNAAVKIDIAYRQRECF
jgi:hypothetical protein